MNKPKLEPVEPKERRPYQKPNIIYQNLLQTRAGSPLGEPNSDPFDPAGLFDTD